MIKFLGANISTYSIDIPESVKINPRYEKPRRFVEVIPEIIVSHYNNPSDFTSEFVRLLKERIKNEEH